MERFLLSSTCKVSHFMESWIFIPTRSLDFLINTPHTCSDACQPFPTVTQGLTLTSKAGLDSATSMQQDRISELCTLILITQMECQNVRGKSLSGSIVLVTAPTANESSASIAFQKNGRRPLSLLVLFGRAPHWKTVNPGVAFSHLPSA